MKGLEEDAKNEGWRGTEERRVAGERLFGKLVLVFVTQSLVLVSEGRRAF